MNIWNNLSISKKLFFVVGIMTVLIFIELMTLRFAMNNLSAVRAFVSGEAMWSKAQKNAVYQLQRYAFTHNEEDFQAFTDALIIPEGDHVARMELEKPNPDMRIVRKGFVAGQIHPDDIDGMVKLLRRFYWFDYVARALAAWREGDVLLTQLKEIGFEYHGLAINNAKNEPRLNEILLQINDLNFRLTKIESDFSLALGEGSRWLEYFVFVSLLGLVMTVESIGLMLTFLTSRSLSKNLKDLNRFAEDIGKGNFGKVLEIRSRDEIGQLTQSVNEMSLMLSKSYTELQESHHSLEEKVEQRTAELEEAIKTRDEFLSIASHELRTPTTGLLLALQLLERSVEQEINSETIVQIKDRIHKASIISKKIASLNNILLDLTRIRLGRFELSKTQTNLYHLVNETFSQLHLEATKNGSVISFEGDQNVIINIDSVRVGQVLTNLISNAIKYGDKSKIEIRLRRENNAVWVDVQDFGPGIPFDKQGKIFERFERANTDEAISGLGLGLYISRQIIEAHQGFITLKSIPGEGSLFTIMLPIS